MLAEAHESLPSEIIELVPHISAVQLAEYGELVEKSRAAVNPGPQELDSSAILEAIRDQAARHVSFIGLLKRKVKQSMMIWKMTQMLTTILLEQMWMKVHRMKIKMKFLKFCPRMDQILLT